MNIQPTNEETGQSAWTYTENRYNRGSPPQQKFNYAEYNARELAKAKQKQGGGILNTNAESGLDTWQYGKYQQAGPAPPKDYFEQYQNQKPKGGILRTNVESGAWNYASREYMDPNAIKRFNDNLMMQQNNNNYYVQNNNNFVQNNNFQGMQNMNNNYIKNNIDDEINEEDVVKVQTNEKIIVENGVKKKITKVTKYLKNGDKRTEINKINV